MKILIMKFGANCLKNEISFKRIYEITKIYEDSKKFYIISAFNGISDLLLNIANSITTANTKEIDNSLKKIKKIHVDVIEQIFYKDSIYYRKVKDWIDLKLNELSNILAEIQEFGLEAYYLDHLYSFGELMATYILCEYLQSRGIDSLYVPANQFLITDDNYNNAFPLYNLIENRIRNRIIPILESNKKNIIFCITGFIGRNKLGNITTLGKGGSDYTATILAHSLYEIGNDYDIRVILWKDVDGLFAINPKYIPDSNLIRNINYSEAKQFANFGAKILHPKCLDALESKKIPLEIRNFNNPNEKVNYTLISEYTDGNTIKGISAIENVSIITITSGSMVDVPGVLAKIFKTLGKNGISVSLVSQSASEISTSFVVKEEDCFKAIEALKSNSFFAKFFDINFENIAIINITGVNVLENRIKTRIFEILDKNNIQVRALSQSFDEINISLVVNRKKLIDAIKLIHDYIGKN